MSQPARAVWIEIPAQHTATILPGRHSLRGLCGLKCVWVRGMCEKEMSQPARAVWIEIFAQGSEDTYVNVTACEGCVD